MLTESFIENLTTDIYNQLSIIDTSLEAHDVTIKKSIESYLEQTIFEFENPAKSPYDIKREEFVDDLDVKCNHYVPGKHKAQICDENITPIANMLAVLGEKKKPIVITGNYGMGKSTIAKHLFLELVEKGVFPIFIELGDRDIDTLTSLQTKWFSKEILNGLFAHDTFADDMLRESVLDAMMKLLRHNDIVLILDAIDESIVKSDEALDRLISTILHSNTSVYISSREEYTPFIATFAAKVHAGNYKEHLHVVLQDWKQKQWDAYESRLLAKEEFQHKHLDIRTLFEGVRTNRYGDIPSRPLFLKMLTKLKLENDLLGKSEQFNYFALNEMLSANRSEIYFKYLQWQLYNDIVKHAKNEVLNNPNSLIKNEKDVIDAWFELLSYIAVNEYAKIIAEKPSRITLNGIMQLAKKSEIASQFLSDQFIHNALKETSVFAILRRDDRGTQFTFAHKSFMEYFVAYRLAFSIFEKDEPSCDEVWGYYQTHEVSQHFMFEVERVNVTQWLSTHSEDSILDLEVVLSKSKKRCDTTLIRAFSQAISYMIHTRDKQRDLLRYDRHHLDSERFEEALFYIGRFKLGSNSEILEILEDIIASQEKYHPVYYRTASLSLAQVHGMEYCNRYVSRQLHDMLNGNHKQFDINMEIQRQYYGADTVLVDKVKKNLVKYIEDDDFKRDIIANDILTYFAVASTLEQHKKDDLKQLMHRLISRFQSLELNNLISVCQLVEQIFLEANDE